MTMKVEFYENKRAKDASQRWRWRLLASNGKIVAESGEGYARESAARKTFERIQTAFVGGKVKEVSAQPAPAKATRATRTTKAPAARAPKRLRSSAAA